MELSLSQKMKNNKRKIMSLSIVFGILFIFAAAPVSQGLATAGTTGSFDSQTATQANQGDWVTFVLTGLNANSEYILVQSTVGNTTFSTGSGQTTAQVLVKVDSSGSLTFSLYGYDISTGIASGSVIASWLLTVTASTNYNANGLTNLIPYFIGLLIAGLLIGVAVGKKAF